MLAFDLLKPVHLPCAMALALLLSCTPQVDDTGNVNANGAIEDLCATGPAPTPTGESLTLDLGGGVTMELVRIPAGEFMMGTESAGHWQLDRSGPLHCVSLAHDFYIGRYEVTQEQWEAVAGTSIRDHLNGAWPGIPLPGEGPNYPMHYVSWEEAVEFCELLSARTDYDIGLPTEAEWEYACRAGTATGFSFGDDEGQLDDHAWYGDNSASAPHEVGTKLPNTWGLHDMHGNVWEWCQDFWHEDYSGAPSDGSAWTTGGDPRSRVIRGGSFFSPPVYCRSALRAFDPPEGRFNHTGFRVTAASQHYAPE